MARTDDKPRGDAEFTRTIPRREGRRRKSTDDKPRGDAEFTQTIPRREGRRRKSTDDKLKEMLSLLRLSRGAKEEDEVKSHI